METQREKIARISSLLESETLKLTNSKESWLDFLTIAARLYKYDFKDSIIIAAHKPNASMCADFNLWSDKLHYKIKQGTKGIPLLREVNGYVRPYYVYDISDTEIQRNTKKVGLWSIKPEHKRAVEQRFSTNFGAVNDNANLESLINERIDMLLNENIGAYIDEVEYNAKGSLVEELDRQNLAIRFRSIVEESVKIMVCERAGISRDIDEEALRYIGDFNTIDVITQLGTAVNDTASTVLREIEKEVRYCEKYMKNERTGDYNERTGERRNEDVLQHAGAEMAAAVHRGERPDVQARPENNDLSAAGGDRPRRTVHPDDVGTAQADISEREQKGNISEADDKRAVGAPRGDGQGSEQVGRYVDAADVGARGDNGRTETAGSDEMGRTAEQPEAESTRDSLGTGNIRINETAEENKTPAVSSFIQTIELEKYSEPDENGRVKRIGMATLGEVFEQLEAHLKANGMLPDEYFGKDLDFDPNMEVPEFAQFVCHPYWGASEGIYLDISMETANGVIAFATGKTLEDNYAAFKRMGDIATECNIMLNSNGRRIERDGISTPEYIKNVMAEKAEQKEATDSLIFAFRKDGSTHFTESKILKDFVTENFADKPVSFALINAVIGYLDEKQHIEREDDSLNVGWYDKTDIYLSGTVDGKTFEYEDRFDIGDGIEKNGGTIIDRIRTDAESAIADLNEDNPYYKEAQDYINVFIPYFEKCAVLSAEEQKIFNDFKAEYPIRSIDKYLAKQEEKRIKEDNKAFVETLKVGDTISLKGENLVIARIVDDFTVEMVDADKYEKNKNIDPDRMLIGHWRDQLVSAAGKTSLRPIEKEAEILTSTEYKIYQLKDTPETRGLRFEAYRNLDDTSDPDINNYNLIYEGKLENISGYDTSDILETLYKKFNMDHPEDFKGHSLSMSDIVVLNNGNTETAHYVDDKGFVEVPDFLTERTKDISLETAEETVDIYINAGAPQIEELKNHFSNNGYDIKWADDNSHFTAYKDDAAYIETIISDRNIEYSVNTELPKPEKPLEQAQEENKNIIGNTPYRFIPKKTYRTMPKERAELVAKRFENEDIKFSGKINENGSITLTFSKNDLDECNNIINDVVAQQVVEEHRAKTREMYNPIASTDLDNLEAIMFDIVQGYIDDNNLDISIKDLTLYGSRSRGIENENSDIDIVIEYDGTMREDAVFNIFNEEDYHFAGIKVDFNPIHEEESGTLETYLPYVEEYINKQIKSAEKADKPVEKTDRNDIIGNTVFKYIPKKHYEKFDKDLGLAVSAAFTEQGIKHSGKINGDSVTLTMSKNDLDKCKEIIEEVKAKFAQPAVEEQTAEEQPYIIPDIIKENMPDPDMSIEDRNNFGYTYEAMLPLSEETAIDIWENKNLPIYLLYDDNTESMAESIDDIENHNGIFGIEAPDWERYITSPEYQKMQTAKEVAAQPVSDEEHIKGIPKSIIIKALISGSGFVDGKFRIEKIYKDNKDAKTRISAVKNEYGWGGHYSASDDIGAVTGFSHDGKGVKIEWTAETGSVKGSLKWNDVDKVLKELIENDLYISDAEREKYERKMFVKAQIDLMTEGDVITVNGENFTFVKKDDGYRIEVIPENPDSDTSYSIGKDNKTFYIDNFRLERNKFEINVAGKEEKEVVEPAPQPKADEKIYRFYRGREVGEIKMMYQPDPHDFTTVYFNADTIRIAARIATDNGETDKSLFFKMLENYGKRDKVSDDTLFFMSAKNEFDNNIALMEGLSEENMRIVLNFAQTGRFALPPKKTFDKLTEKSAEVFLGIPEYDELGTWSVVGTTEEDGKTLFILENDNRGYTIDIPHLIADEDGNVVDDMPLELNISEEEKTIHFYQNGNNYEAYGTDADNAAIMLGLSIEKRNNESFINIVKNDIYDYIAKLEENGFRVDVYEEAAAELEEIREEFDAKESIEDKPFKLPNTVAHRNFVNLQKLYPEIFSGEHSSEKYKGKDSMEDFSIELNGNELTLMHTFKQNGDLMYDPRIDYRIDFVLQTIQALNYEMSSLGLYQEYPDFSRGQRDCNNFTATWIKNLEEQKGGRYLAWAVEQYEHNGENYELSVYYDENGNITEMRGDDEAVEAYKAEKGIVENNDIGEQEIAMPKEEKTIHFYRYGDFYEAYGADAENAAIILDLHIIKKKGEDMVGVPKHNLDHYMGKLEDEGFSVLVSENTREEYLGKDSQNKNHSEWRSTSNPIAGDMMYSVYRVIDTNEIEYSGNRENAMPYIYDENMCIQIAKTLNDEGITDFDAATKRADELMEELTPIYKMLTDAIQDHKTIHFKDKPKEETYVKNASDLDIKNEKLVWGDDGYQLRGDTNKGEDMYLMNFGTNKYKIFDYIISHDMEIDHIETPKMQAHDLKIGDVVKLPPVTMVSTKGDTKTFPSEYGVVEKIDDRMIHFQTYKDAELTSTVSKHAATFDSFDRDGFEYLGTKDEISPHINADDIQVGDKFIYKGDECTVIELSGQRENDISISYLDDMQLVYMNIDKNELAKYGKYLGRDMIEQAKDFLANYNIFGKELDFSDLSNIELLNDTVSSPRGYEVERKVAVDLKSKGINIKLGGIYVNNAPYPDLDSLIEALGNTSPDDIGHISDDMWETYYNYSDEPEINAAKQLISEYIEEEFSTENETAAADFSDLKSVSLAYTTADSPHDEEIIVEAEADIENRKINVFLGDVLAKVMTFDTSAEFESYLGNMTFGELTYVDDEMWDKFYTVSEKEEQQLAETQLERAKQLINAFCIENFDTEAEFDDLKNISILFSYYDVEVNGTKEELPVQMYVDLENFSISKYVEDVKVSEFKYDDLVSFIQEELENLDFNQLLPVTDEERDVYIKALDQRKAALSEKETRTESASNFVLTEDKMNVGGQKTQFRANIEAIKLLKQLEADKAQATPEQQDILGKYMGWGGLSDAFDEKKDSWASEYAELKELLTPEEYKSARATVKNSHYTSPTIIQAMYKTLERLGFEGGTILEPSMGVGNFFGAMPDSLKNSKLYGVELDDLTGRFAKQLYPNANIQIKGFQKTAFNSNSFDVAVGNVPFGNYRIYDRELQTNDLIHDYFFEKALDKVHPGGVIAFITSMGTMDKTTDNVRKYLAARAELLGAVRLPDTAMKNANTEVTSDIIFLKKRDEVLDFEKNPELIPDWVDTKENADGYIVNSYFADDPEAVVGKVTSVSGPYGRKIVCKLEEGQDFAETLENALTTVKGSFEYDEHANSIEEEIDPAYLEVSYVGHRNFCYCLVDDKIYFRENEMMIPQKFEGKKAERIRGMIEVSEALQEVIRSQRENYTDDYIAEKQAELNDVYEKFTKKFGLISSDYNKSLFKEDDTSELISSLENLDEDGNLVSKADIFTKRTIVPYEPPTHADTVSDALTISISEKARVDLAYMSELCGKTKDEILDEMQGVIFENPVSGKYETADEYLSGDVREKLRVAELMAESNPKYKINVESLKAVQPEELTPKEISVQLCSTWIPVKYYEQFVYELLDTPRRCRSENNYYGSNPFEAGRNPITISVQYDERSATFGISNKGSAKADSNNIKVYKTYGTERVNAYKIIEDTLNNKTVVVKDYIEEPDGKKKAVVNQKETILAQEKQEEVKQLFKEWIWQDPDRTVELCRIYNEKFNSIRPREYDGSHIKFVGMNPNIKLRPHQKNAIAHTLYGGNTLLAHTMGAGKTFEMVASAMEAKRLGLCRKSLICVPKHIVNQFGKEFMQLYPNANILVATEKDFSKKNRRRFFSRIATGNYDAVIISHSQLEKLPLSPERRIEYVQNQIDEITAALEELRLIEGKRGFTVKQMEAERANLEAKIESLIKEEKYDTNVFFEDMGFDRMFVDEAHYFKNKQFVTKMGRNVAGINASSVSQRATDLEMKIMYMDEITGSRGCILSTGTPEVTPYL